MEKCITKYFRIYCTDCTAYFERMKDNSVDLIITDPPYFIDQLGDDWDRKKVKKSSDKGKVIQGLPVGMKFDPNQGIKLQAYMEPISQHLFRILRPGGFCIVFSQARLFHRMAISFESAGFEIRDMFIWKYEGQAKAFSQDHFIKKNKNLSPDEKRRLLKELQGYKTPQLKPQFEPMVFAQKPKIGTHLDNWRKYQLGLMDTKIRYAGDFPGNVFDIPKYGKGLFSNHEKIDHPTVKPVELITPLVLMFSKENQIIFDPFMGSGSHGIAACKHKRRFIGVEREEKYWEMAKRRLEEIISYKKH